MGAIRLLLAASVVLSHTTPIAGYFGIPPNAAVTCFFIISGFYMGLVATEKYTGKNRFFAFYSNRFLRLYPTYVIALFIAFAVRIYLANHAGLSGEQFGRNGIFFFPPNMDIIGRVLLTMPNLILVGSDIPFLFSFGAQSGWHFTLGQNVMGLVNVQRTGICLMIPPAWSIGLELWFYMLVPFLVRWRSNVLVLIAALSLVLRLKMEFSHPWSSYFFFPANLGFFVIGIIAYRIYRSSRYRAFATRPRVYAVFWFVIATLVLRQYIPFYRNYAWQLYVLFAATLPFLFHASKTWSLDHWIGNLSYPVYIIHAPVITFLDKCFNLSSGLVVLTVTLVLSIILLILVEQPLDHFRQKRIEGAVGPKQQ